MEETSGIAASLPVEATNSTASTTAAPMTNTEPIAYPAGQQNPEAFSSSSGNAEAETASNERTIPFHELKTMLRQQLEYYFSRENLATDTYLRTQMDGDQYVPIATIARFNQIRRLTEDLPLIVEALRESPYVQVDETGEKVRPSQRSIVLILREIPESTPMKDFEELFSGENCPKFARCEFAHNDTWYVLFDTDEDAKKAYCYLREEAKTFNGKPIMARIKASLTSAPYAHSYKNGIVPPPTTESYNPQQMPQQQQQAHLQYTYANMPNENYNSQQICPPFYPPTMLQAWAPTTAACVDLAAVFSMNGLSPQAAYRPLTNKNSYPSRDRPVKSFNPQQSYSSRSEQSSSRYYSRNQSFLPRQQQQQQQTPFFNNLNANSFDYMPYPSGSRNIQFGFDSINFFPPQNLCFRKLPSHSSYTSQSRHNPLVLSRSAVGMSAINTQDQSYISMGGSSSQFAKDSMASNALNKPSADNQGKENWAANQNLNFHYFRQRNKRWSKENGTNSSARHFPENSNDYFNKTVNGSVKPDSPKFDLETASFPPLPGYMDTGVLEVDVYESRLSDIVKGTVKPSTRDTKTQTAEESLKENSTLAIEEPVQSSDGAFTPPAALIPDISSMDQVASEELEDWGTEPLANDSSNEACIFSNSISSATQTLMENSAFNLANPLVTPSISANSLSMSSLLISPMSSQNAEVAIELETPANVPNESEKQAVLKAAAKHKPQQPEVLPKMKSSDLPSPKGKIADSSGKGKGECNKDKVLPIAKHRPPMFSSNKTQESSSSKDKMDSATASAIEMGAAKFSNAEVFSPKDKMMPGQGIPVKGRSFDLPQKPKGPEIEPTVSLLSVNGHIDSESTVSSEDEKPFRKLTYSEVAMRAKEKVEKLAQELKEKERQEALVRHHRQQEITAQSRQGGPFRDFTRRVSERPGPRDWRDRRKPARAVSLPSAGQ